MAEQWLSIVEYARAFSLSDMTVRRRIKNGKINAVLKDGKYYIPVGAEKPGGPAAHARPAMNRPVIRPSVPHSTGFGSDFEQPVLNEFRNQKAVAHTPAPAPAAAPYHSISNNAGSFSYAMPEAVAKPLMNHDHTLVHSEQLLNFCHTALKKQEFLEKQVGEKYQARIASLESALQARNIEIAQLKQQIEDLQLLVKVFEKKQGE